MNLDRMMNTGENMFSFMWIFGGLIFIVAAVFIIFVFAMIFSPKLKSKFMGKQIKANKYMIDDNAEVMRETSTKMAQINSDGIEITAQAIKKGLTNEEKVFCKYCGQKIDIDSVFCNKCGKEQ